MGYAKNFIIAFHILGIPCILISIADILTENSDAAILTPVVIFIPMYFLWITISLIILFARSNKLRFEKLSTMKKIINFNAILSVFYLIFYYLDIGGDFTMSDGNRQSFMEEGAIFWGFSPIILSVLHIWKLSKMDTLALET